MLSDRRRIVLQALVNEYVRSAQPVASKALVDRYDLRVSPATVRSELSFLDGRARLAEYDVRSIIDYEG